MILLGFFLGFTAYLFHDIWIATKDVLIDKIRKSYKND